MVKIFTVLLRYAEISCDNAYTPYKLPDIINDNYLIQTLERLQLFFLKSGILSAHDPLGLFGYIRELELVYYMRVVFNCQ